MLKTALAPVLSHATADVLEKMFFTGFVAESERAPGDTAQQIVVTVEFDGGRRGLLALAISTSAARSLATDFLGVDTEAGANEEQVKEVVRELANMICGDALSTLEQKALVLSSPQIVKAGDFVPSPGSCERCFDLGNGWLTASLDLRDGDD